MTRSIGSDVGMDLFSLCLTSNASVLPQDIWSAWSFAPAVAVPLGALALVCGARALAMCRTGDRRNLVQRAAPFACGLLLLSAALLSPLCRLAANLASAHMVQHAILVALAPPLLVVGWPGSKGFDAARARFFRPLAHPLAWAGAYGALIWLWHIPRLYETALLDPATHLLMYASLLAVSLLFWRSIIAAGAVSAEERAFAIPALLVTVLHTGLLGALLSFSPRLWYPLMAPGAVRWGLTPLEDQQLAGLIMWVPMAAVYLAAALWLIARSLAGVQAREAPAPFASPGTAGPQAPVSDLRPGSRA